MTPALEVAFNEEFLMAKMVYQKMRKEQIADNSSL
jgi:hypothetical protein